MQEHEDFEFPSVNQLLGICGVLFVCWLFISISFMI